MSASDFTPVCGDISKLAGGTAAGGGAADAPASSRDGSSVEPSAVRPPPTEETGVDYDPEREVDADIKAIGCAYSAWDAADAEFSAAEARSVVACHRALGEIFARSGPTDEDHERKRVLIRKVKEHRDVMDSARYNPFDHDAAELHLTLQFGLKARRGVKSNWKTALEAGEICLANGTIKERSVTAFEVWFKPVGMAGARDILDSEPGGKSEAQGAAIEGMQGVPFDLPIEAKQDGQEPREYGLMVVRFSQEPGDPAPTQAIGLVFDDAVVASARAALLRQKKRQQRELLADAEEALKNMNTPECRLELLIPKRRRHEFDGRTHYIDEDERNESDRERKLERKYVRKKLGGRKALKTQAELAREGRGKRRLPPECLNGATAGDHPDEFPATPVQSDVVAPPEEGQQPPPSDEADPSGKGIADVCETAVVADCKPPAATEEDKDEAYWAGQFEAGLRERGIID